MSIFARHFFSSRDGTPRPADAFASSRAGRHNLAEHRALADIVCDEEMIER
jgi:hypothetical protein